jgi:hypothetical protein
MLLARQAAAVRGVSGAEGAGRAHAQACPPRVAEYWAARTGVRSNRAA